MAVAEKSQRANAAVLPVWPLCRKSRTTVEKETVMRECVLFIAMSLDGYIADKEGGVGWLEGQRQDEENQDVYSEFIKEVDTVLMGYTTYHQVVTELSPTQWVYEGMKTYVFTHRKIPSQENIIFTKEAPGDLVERLKKKPGRNIWVCGGAELVRQLIEKDCIDVYYLSVIPTILGGGVRLFPSLKEEKKLRLADMKTYNGIMDLIYRPRG